jgi:hypothetical protein
MLIGSKTRRQEVDIGHSAWHLYDCSGGNTRVCELKNNSNVEVPSKLLLQIFHILNFFRRPISGVCEKLFTSKELTNNYRNGCLKFWIVFKNVFWPYIDY